MLLYKMKKNKTHKCRTKPYKWNTRKVIKSPFHTINRAKNVEQHFLKGKSIGFTGLSSLKSMGRIPRSHGCIELGQKYVHRPI